MNGMLNAADIEKASASVTEYLKLQHIQNKEIIRIRLGMEDALLRFMDRFGEVPFTVRMGRLLGKVKISVSVEGEVFDLFTKDGDSESENELMRNALVNAGELPVWRYARHQYAHFLPGKEKASGLVAASDRYCMRRSAVVCNEAVPP